MRNRVVVSIGALVLTIIPAAGQESGPAAKVKTAGAVKEKWTPRRTPDGQPDIQGVWTNNSVTPLQRPKGLGTKEFYSQEELAKIQKQQRERFALDEQEGEPADSSDGQVHFDHAQFASDYLQSQVNWNRRTSLIVGPEGTIPPLTPEAVQRVAAIKAKQKGHEFDGPENLPLESRCLARANNGPPLLPKHYNNNLEIVQGPGYVAMETEEIHDVRIIPLDGRPHLPKNIRQWKGDSRGHWDGDALVIDTTNFTDLTPFPGAQNVHVVERLTRVDEDTMLYQFTVEDPGMWTKPWSGEIPISKIAGKLYEYACNEANYGLEDTLHGARVAEAEATQKESK
jgi:hypothetical protein